jgi:hypothetical protein
MAPIPGPSPAVRVKGEGGELVVAILVVEALAIVHEAVDLDGGSRPPSPARGGRAGDGGRTGSITFR